jgi:hypothetical protein
MTETIVFERNYWTTPGENHEILNLCEDITMIDSENKVMGRFLWFIEMRAIITNGNNYSDLSTVRYD